MPNSPLNEEDGFLRDSSTSLTSSIQSRRNFIAIVAGALFARTVSGEHKATSQVQAEGYFTVGERNNRWWLLTPNRQPMFSIGLNHLDPSPLQTGGSDSIWQQRYRSDILRWLKDSVRKNLSDWGFNTLGWSQELTSVDSDGNHYDRGLTQTEFAALQMPYGHVLPFRSPGALIDFRSDEFAERCDVIASEHCSAFRDDPNLIGYWLSNAPSWTDVYGGDSKTSEQATAYYRTTREAIRRYDPHHLILGDRYDATARLPKIVAEAALPHIDVLSFRCRGSGLSVAKMMTRVGKLIDRPVIVADHVIERGPVDNNWPPKTNRFHDAGRYSQALLAMTGLPNVIGYHLCGAYLRGDLRRRGLLDERERVDASAIAEIRRANLSVAEWVKKASVEREEK